MRKLIQLSVLFIYFITSSFVVGVNRWAHEGSEEKSFAESLFSACTLPIGDATEDNSELLLIFKDPSDDGTVVINYCPGFITFEFISHNKDSYSEDKVSDPSRNVFSPPPQFS